MIPYRARAIVAAVALLFVVGPPGLAQSTGLSLSQALAALPNAPGWKKAELDYRSAADALAAARAAAGLQISAGGSYNLTDTLSGTSSRNGSSAALSVSASATVLPWAPVDATITNAELSLRVAALSRDSARNGLVLTVEQQYFAARLASTARDLAQNGLDEAQAKLAAARAQRSQGQLSAEGLAQAQAAVASAQASLAQAQSSLDLARRALYGSLGMPVSDAALTTAPPQDAGPSGSLDQLLKDGVPKRDDVQTAQVRVQQAQGAVSASVAQRWIPAASLTIGVSSSDTTGTQVGLGVSAGLDFQKGVLSGSASYPVAASASGAASTQLRIGAAVTIPIDAPSGDASIRSSQTALQSAQAALSAAELAAELDIRQRYATWQGAQATLVADQASADAARQALDTAQARLAAGLATQLDVGAAELALGQVQRTVEADQNTLYLALLQLRTALGEPIATPGGQP